MEQVELLTIAVKWLNKCLEVELPFSLLVSSELTEPVTQFGHFMFGNIL